jgi:hypothetical protein
LSEDALVFARKLAASKYRYPDDRLAVADLLERWNLGLGTTLAERRMALRLSREQAAIDLPDTGEPEAASLPSVCRVLHPEPSLAASETPERTAERGDVDETDVDDFYADALEDV